MAGNGAALRVVSSATWLEQVLSDFERHLIRGDKSPATTRIYRWAIADLFALMKRGGMRDISELDRNVLEIWQDQMIARGMKPRSRALAIVAARQLIKWAAKREFLPIRLEDVLGRPRMAALEPRPIPPEDLAKIKAYLFPIRRNMRLIDYRDRALFAFLLSTGARVSEALQVTRNAYIGAVVVQKGGSKKELLLPPVAAQMVADYVSRRRDDSPWLWTSSIDPRHRLNPQGVREIWRKLAAKLELEEWTTHQIRHTAATELFAAGVPDAVISKVLGHKSMQMLEVYRKVRTEQRQIAVEAMAKVLEISSPPIEVKRPSRRRSWARLRRPT